MKTSRNTLYLLCNAADLLHLECEHVKLVMFYGVNKEYTLK
jgi:hypothetical protein